MIGKPQIATLYIWEKDQPFNKDYLFFILGGLHPQSDQELRRHRPGWPMFCTQDFRIYPITKAQDTEMRTNHGGNTNYPHFSTIMLEERLSDYRLEVPDHEVIFIPRLALITDGVKTEKVQAVAAQLAVCGLEVLAVPGTSIEKDQLFASKDIANKLGIAMIPA